MIEIGPNLAGAIAYTGIIALLITTLYFALRR